MNLNDLWTEPLGLLLRFFPWRSPTGLQQVGSPDPDSPVLVTGNYRITLQRLRRALAGRDVWLLVVDSHGINVWCAAAGGHLTSGSVISAVRVTGLGDRVQHRELVLPQLAATGLEPDRIETAVGWSSQFGPVRAEDLPAYLDGTGSKREMRTVRFGLPQRLEMAAMWALPLAGLGLGIGWPLAGLRWAGAGAAAVLASALLLFGLAPWLPLQGARRWGMAAAIASVFSALLFLLAGTPPELTELLWASGLGLALGALLCIDYAGSTPSLPSDLHATADLAVVIDAERCTGTTHCLQVCPRAVLVMQQRIAVVRSAEDCIRCAACVVRCPADAIQLEGGDGTALAASEARGLKLDILGRRRLRGDGQASPDPATDR